jgi:chemotaxis protein methyltransferase CheR
LTDWDITILATDINPEGFAAARAAEYTQWSFRGTPSWVMDGYFTKTRDGRYRLTPAIQEMVTFSHLNLVEDPYPSDCDLILCRNVMMYFSRETAVRVAEKLRQALREGGYLLVTASETSRDIQGPLTTLNLGGEIFYKKTPPAPEVATAPAPRAPATQKPSRPDRAVQHRAPQSARGKKAEPAQRVRRSTPEGQRGGLHLERRAYSREERPAAAPVEHAEAKAAASKARLLADRGELDQALVSCDTALECEKLNPSLYYLKASILQELGRPDEAEHALQSTLFLDGGFALARIMLGAIARSQARTREAAKHFREALALLEQMPSDLVLAETNGLTAGEMVETVASLIESERVS